MAPRFLSTFANYLSRSEIRAIMHLKWEFFPDPNGKTESAKSVIKLTPSVVAALALQVEMPPSQLPSEAEANVRPQVLVAESPAVSSITPPPNPITEKIDPTVLLTGTELRSAFEVLFVFFNLILIFLEILESRKSFGDSTTAFRSSLRSGPTCEENEQEDDQANGKVAKIGSKSCRQSK